MIEVSIDNSKQQDDFVSAVSEKLNNAIFMCIGTEKVFSDSLGPRVGTLLNENLQYPKFVYGLHEQNITAENLQYCYDFIKTLHPNCKIVVIDAAVGTKDQLGRVQLCDGGIVPGAATNKNLPTVGDVSIVGIVAEKGMADFYTLNSEKDRLVNEVAQYIAKAILKATKKPNSNYF